SFFTVMRYSPGVTLGNVYCPAEFVCCVAWLFVALLCKTTVASATTAPVASVTVPSTVPVETVCAFVLVVELAIRNRKNTPAINRESFDCLIPHLAYILEMTRAMGRATDESSRGHPSRKFPLPPYFSRAHRHGCRPTRRSFFRKIQSAGSKTGSLDYCRLFTSDARLCQE